MNRKGKSWPLFVVAILIVLFSLTAIFGVSYTYGDTKNVYVKGESDIRFGIDIRGGVDSFQELLEVIDRLREGGTVCRLLYLEADTQSIIKRYKETRRRHPMNDDVGIGIQTEREILIPLKEKANYIVDTTNMRLNELRKTVEDILMRGKNIPLRLIISSFGFKRGIPKNADFIFDMRYTANPFRQG